MDRGNTIKYEEFIKLPDGCVSSGIISDSEDGVFIDGTDILLYYIVYKYSNQDWAVFCLRDATLKGMTDKEKEKFVLDTGTKVENTAYIKRVFNCSRKVLNLYTY